jgi:fluoride exporter
VIGCFAAGFLAYSLFERFLVSETMRTVLLIGLLGGFTTFSSFGLQTFNLLRDGEVGLALLNIAVSNIAGLAMVWLGFNLARIF